MKGNVYSLVYVLATNTILDLSNNNLSGEIPAGISSLSQMRLLNLSGNHLKGGIPASLGEISTLEQLDLSRNYLSGKIPQELSKLYLLSYFNVSFNSLCGQILGGPQFATFDTIFYQGNPPCLCGYPLPKCKKDTLVPPPQPPPYVRKSVWSIVDDHVPVVAVGLGWGIGFGATVLLIIWWDTLWRCIRALKIRAFYGVTGSQTCSWSLNYSPHFTFHSSTSTTTVDNSRSVKQDVHI
ncbi:receptor-like protein 9DC3 [Cryptomeria japonica]|uniref:receptor-like protein 9DC3 n=1 Tax=Cryptomeria japonica TaxID=3369 RepID=UPI0027DA1823|nr:receptor-like protein 9DC3 [Cryptomeria japonica]